MLKFGLLNSIHIVKCSMLRCHPFHFYLLLWENCHKIHSSMIRLTAIGSFSPQIDKKS